jgi:alkylation response protein AidB-like acyl-CoA dehydrogenase
VPEDQAGAGLPLVDSAVLADEFGYAGVPAPIGVSIAATQVLLAASSGDEHLRALASGQHFFTVSEATRLRGHFGHAGANRAVGLTADGGTLRGTLPQVPFASLADVVLAPLTIDGEPAFAAVPLEGAGVTTRPLIDRRHFGDVSFDGQALADSSVLATGAAATALHERCDVYTTALSLAEVVGAMQRCLEMSASYISTRVQFGQPIAKFQAARHRAAEMMMAADTSRWAVYHALWQLEQDPDASAEVWLAKHWAVRAADEVYAVAHLLHGGVGVNLDYPLHLFTLFLAGAAVRGGTMNEVTTRILADLEIPTGASGSGS